jgi:hypothetical protein
VRLLLRARPATRRGRPRRGLAPPRFANKVGVAFLGAASLALGLGYGLLGWTLGLLVAGLALAAAATGICAGCEIYKLLARVRGIELCATCVGGEVLSSEE